MGVYLTLCPVKYRDLVGFLAYDRIGLDRDYRTFDQVAALPARPLPAGQSFRWFAEEGVVERTEDPYGDPLRCLTAGELAGVTLPPDATAWNRAAWAFVRELPPETVVVLWWY